MASYKDNPFSFWMNGQTFDSWSDSMGVTVTDAQPELVWVDTETTGLVASREVTLQLGIILTDRAGNVCIDGVVDWLVYDNGEHTYKKNPASHKNWASKVTGMDAFVSDMHNKSGLTKSIQVVAFHPDSERAAPHRVGLDANDWLNERFGWESAPEKISDRKPMSGSSPQFDRGFVAADLPYLNSWFHYRSGVDVSGIRENAKLVNPKVVESQPKPMQVHHPIPDLIDSIRLYRHLLRNFLNIDDKTKELLG